MANITVKLDAEQMILYMTVTILAIKEKQARDAYRNSKDEPLAARDKLWNALERVRKEYDEAVAAAEKFLMEDDSNAGQKDGADPAKAGNTNKEVCEAGPANLRAADGSEAAGP